jgi:hypothetical protein
MILYHSEESSYDSAESMVIFTHRSIIGSQRQERTLAGLLA